VLVDEATFPMDISSDDGSVGREKISLLVDCGAIKVGGGVQLALNFINFFRKYPSHIGKVFFLVPKGGILASRGNFECDEAVIECPDGYFGRKWFELFFLRCFIRKHDIRAVFTFFGAGLPVGKNVFSVVCVAYPIICYADSSYWGFIPRRRRLRTRVVNYLRIRRIRRASVVVAETDVMANRLASVLKIARDNVVVSPPVPSAFVRPVERTRGTGDQGVRLLVLSGLDPHKNLWRLPSMALEMEALGFDAFTFVVSVDRGTFETAYPAVRDSAAVLDRRFRFVGSIPPDRIQEVYDDSDFLVNISDLESFSNNYIEAWKAGLPLICSRRDFAVHICGASAVYVEPHDPVASASAMIRVIRDRALQESMIIEGAARLRALPLLEEKFVGILNLVRREGA
jgi:glycosyltransferase involved in cell wall biosynthesis